MCLIFSEQFTGIFLFLYLVNFGSSLSGISVYASTLNTSEEIKHIFSHFDVIESTTKGTPGTGNYGEGGLIQVNVTQPVLWASKKDLLTNSVIHKNSSYKKNFTKKHSTSTTTENISHPSIESSSIKTLLPAKLNEAGSNLFLGIPEVIHFNGTSSIKPRKGVHYNKIVPRKGVDNDNESSHGFFENELCFQLTENECYNATKIYNLECICCKKGNMLAKTIKQQVLVNCKDCKTVNVLFSEKETCKNICCTSVSTMQNTYNNHLNYETITNTQNTTEKVETANNFSKKPIAEMNNALGSMKKNSKRKPSVTKVPYDVEIVTEILSKNQQKVFIPIIVSIFLLPLFGVLLFFLWRRTKEYWEKRQYKRMDFLIDGIYND